MSPEDEELLLAAAKLCGRWALINNARIGRTLGKYCERASRTSARAARKFAAAAAMFWFEAAAFSSRLFSSGSLNASHHLPRIVASFGLGYFPISLARSCLQARVLCKRTAFEQKDAYTSGPTHSRLKRHRHKSRSTINARRSGRAAEHSQVLSRVERATPGLP